MGTATDKKKGLTGRTRVRGERRPSWPTVNGTKTQRSEKGAYSGGLGGVGHRVFLGIGGVFHSFQSL